MTYQEQYNKSVRGMIAEWISGLGPDGQPSVVNNAADLTLYASAARTANSNTADLVNNRARGVRVVIDVTAITLTPSVVFTIEGKDQVSGKYYTLLASAAIVGVGTTVLTVYPGVVEAGNVKVSLPLPRIWRLKIVHADADSITYSVGASYTL